MVGGGFPGRKCVGVKNEIVVGRHPVGPWWKPWIITWMLWVMEVRVLFSPGFAEEQCCSKACLCTFRRAGRTLTHFTPTRADSYSLELDSINFACIETSAMQRKVSFEERSYLYGEGLKCWGRLETAIPSSERFPAPESCSFSPNGAVVAPKMGGLWLP